MSTFNTLSDLLADADDLVLSIDKLADPQLQALRVAVEASIADVKRRARQRIRREIAAARDTRSPGGSMGSNPMGYASALSLAAGVIVALLVLRQPRRRAAD